MIEPLVQGEKIDIRLKGISLASLQEIALMKAYTIGRRTTYRDYIDLYFLLQRGIVSLEYILEKAPQKFVIEGELVFSKRLFLEQLIYTEDIIDKETALISVIGEIPKTDEIEKFLTQQAKTAIEKYIKTKRDTDVKLPEDFKPLFKNYNFEVLDVQKHKELVIKMVLAKGDWEHIEKLFELYGFSQIKKVFLKDFYGVQELPIPTIYLWGSLFLDEKEYWEYRNMRSKMNLVDKWKQTRKVYK